MANIDNTVGGSTVLQNADSRKHYVIENTIDMSKVPVTTADDVSMLNVPAGTLVRAVVIDRQADTNAAALTADVGDGDVSDGWAAGADLKADGLAVGGGALAVFPGKLYTDAGVISLSNFSRDPVDAVVTVRAVAEDVG
jgi:hypothetical protein